MIDFAVSDLPNLTRTFPAFSIRLTAAHRWRGQSLPHNDGLRLLLHKRSVNAILASEEFKQWSHMSCISTFPVNHIFVKCRVTSHVLHEYTTNPVFNRITRISRL
jgi:hypothetical protein